MVSPTDQSGDHMNFYEFQLQTVEIFFEYLDLYRKYHYGGLDIAALEQIAFAKATYFNFVSYCDKFFPEFIDTVVYIDFLNQMRRYIGLDPLEQ